MRGRALEMRMSRPFLVSKDGETAIPRTDSDKRTGLERFSDRIVLLTGLCVLAMTLMVSYDVLMRYFLDDPQLFVDDLTSFLLVAVIFLGAGPVFYKGGHIRIDLVTSRLKTKTQTRMRVITLSIGIALLGIVIYETMVSTMGAFQTGRVSAVMNYPLWMGMIFIPLGLILMIFFMVVELVKAMKGKAAKDREDRNDISMEISH
jgi:TRAP-type C4-dicarboxylate transport system permease small subunit